MDIRGWPFDRIMQMPDCCFGRRFVVSCYVYGETGAIAWDISEVALPDRCVLWEFVIAGRYRTENIESVRIALGDQLPTSAAMMTALEPLIMGIGDQGADPRYIFLGEPYTPALRKLKVPIESQGRRLVFEINPAATASAGCNLWCVFSSVPTEVPDWLYSGNLRSP